MQQRGAELLAHDPLQEDVHRALMEATARAGDRAESLFELLGMIPSVARIRAVCGGAVLLPLL